MTMKNQSPTTSSTTQREYPNEAYIEIAQDAEGWHWCLWAGNGRPLARNAIAYETRKHALQAAKLLAPVAASVKIIVKASEPEK